MKTIKTKDLIEALGIVKPGVAKDERIHQTASFAFIKGRVITYNDEISISHPVENLAVDGAIHAEELYDLLTKLKGEEVTIEATDGEIILKCGKAKAGMALQTEINLPLEDIDFEGKWLKLYKEFAYDLNFLIPNCASSMGAQPILNCVHLREDGKMESSDSYRIAQVTTETKLADVLLPRSSARVVVSLNPTKMKVSGGWVHFTNDAGTIISCRTLDDKFPELDKYINIKGKKLKFPKTAKEIIARAKIFGGMDESGNDLVEITLDKNKMRIKGKSDTGWFSEITKAEWEGEKISFVIIPELLVDILSQSSYTATLSDKYMEFKTGNWVYFFLFSVQS